MKKVTLKDTALKLEQAIETLETKGWIQFSYGDEENGFCLAGVLEHVGLASRGDDLLFELMIPRSYCTISDNCDSITCFNDNKSTTKEDVIEVLKNTLSSIYSEMAIAS